MPESLGGRIAERRTKLCWTQQELAERVGISRVAVSHLEAGLTDPGERTVALLAGVFKVEPHELVADTTYPAAKADRLPLVAAQYTEVEMQLELLANDVMWIERVGFAVARDVVERWDACLLALESSAWERRERQQARDALACLRAMR